MYRHAVKFALFALVLLLSACKSTNTTSTEPVQQIQQYSAEQFFQTTSVSGSSISSNGNKVLVNSDQSGVFNAYAYPVDGSTPKQLTFSKTNATYAISWLPDDQRILYSADQGGNELNHIYVLNKDGSSTDITPGDNLKAMFLGWHRDKTHFYVMTNERDSKAFDVYQVAVQDFSRHMVYQNDELYSISNISPNGQYLALEKELSNKNNNIYVVDLESKSPAKLITPHHGSVSHSVYSFSPDSQYMIFGSDQNGDFMQAYRYQLSDGKIELEYAANWDVVFVYFSHNGRYKVVGINQDAQTKLDIVDTTSNRKLKLPALPQGDMRGVNFSDDEQQMVFYLASDNSPSNLFVHKIGEDTFAKLTNTLNPAIDSTTLVTSDVVRFNSFDGLAVPGLLFKPHQASHTDKVPAIIYIHGGPGGQTRKGYSAMVQHLVNQGYAMFGVNNRGSSGYGKTFFHLDDKRHGEDDLQDIVYAKKYLQSLDWVDGDRIAVMGGSYGGYLTMAAMAFTDEFKLGINIFGVTNWVRTLESIPPWWESFRKNLYDELGDPATDKERLTRISPLFHADKVKKPVLVVQGANDPRVLQVESDEMVAGIRANNVPVEYVLFPDEGHGFRKKENRIRAQEAYLAFLKKYL